MDRGIAVDPTKCTGCNSCELVCYFNKTKVFDPKRSRVKVVRLEYLGFSNPIMCILCVKPKCVAACAPGALTQTKDGLIALEAAKCDGCRKCIDACIVGAISFDEEQKQPLICDLCGGEPACVKWCPPNALTYDGSKEVASTVIANGSTAVAKKHVAENEAVRTKKLMKYTITKARPVLKGWGLPDETLEWYEKWAK